MSNFLRILIPIFLAHFGQTERALADSPARSTQVPGPPKAPAAPPNAGAWSPNSNGLWQPVNGSVVNQMFEGKDGKTLSFIGARGGFAGQFRSLFFFRMPYAISPFEWTSTELRLIKGDSIHVLSRKNSGFRLSSTLPLPAPPGITSPSIDPSEANPPPAVGYDSQNELRRKAWVGGTVGYQLDEKGSLYWIGTQAIFKYEEGGWKSIWTVPKTFFNNRNEPGFIILPGDKIGVFGTEEAFFLVLDLNPADSMESKRIASISYDSFGTCRENLASKGGGFIPQYCVVNGHLFFFLPYVGRMFRMNLDSWGLTEYEVPWMFEIGSPNPNGPSKWQNSGGRIPDNPILPETIAFAPRPDGTVQARALLWNMPMPVVHCFELSSQGSTIYSEIKVDKELQDPLVLLDHLGNLIPLEQMLHSMINPVPNKPSAPNSPVARPHAPTFKEGTP